MRPHSQAGGRHELGQNFLHSPSTIATIADLTRATSGSILEIGPGTGAVTAELHSLHRPLTLVEIDETRISHLQHRFPQARIVHADALRARFDAEVIVGNLPFHLTTPILKRLLRAGSWRSAILLTQWEVARKRAGIGGSTMMTAQWSPWFTFRLIERVPAHAFSPKPSVDGGILTVDRRETGLVPHRDRSSYQQFVHAAFTGRGRGMKGILRHMKLTDQHRMHTTMDRFHVRGDTLPRELSPEQWAGLYTALAADSSTQTGGHGTVAPSGRRTAAAGGHETASTGGRPTVSKKTTITPATARGKETKMRTDKGSKKNRPTGKSIAEAVADSTPIAGVPAADGNAPAPASGAPAPNGDAKPVITGELPIVGAEAPARLEAPIPGVDASAKSHDKAHLQAERGYMPQHGKKSQPQPRWNLPRRQG